MGRGVLWKCYEHVDIVEFGSGKYSGQYMGEYTGRGGGQVFFDHACVRVSSVCQYLDAPRARFLCRL